jgi:hypothetical protein
MSANRAKSIRACIDGKLSKINAQAGISDFGWIHTNDVNEEILIARNGRDVMQISLVDTSLKSIYSNFPFLRYASLPKQHAKS